jgi:hypothetical protein
MAHKQTGLRLIAAALTAAGASPAAAQTIVDAPAILPIINKPCNREDAEIVVCGRRDQPRSPYRLPEPPPLFDGGGNDLSVSRERHSLYEQGDTGIHSCSTVGPGGWTGCTFKKWKDGYEQWGGKQPWERKRPTEYREEK